MSVLLVIMSEISVLDSEKLRWITAPMFITIRERWMLDPERLNRTTLVQIKILLVFSEI